MDPLTKPQAAALRKAASVVFRGNDHAGTIEIILPTPKGCEGDLRMIIPVESRIRSYCGPAGDMQCSDYEGSAQFNPVYMAVASSIRAGDMLRLIWVAGSDNQYMTDAGLHGDFLHVQITRGAKPTILEFMLGYSICPDNSARMVQTKAPVYSIAV